MSDEIKLTKATEQATRASVLLGDEMLQEAWKSREADLIAAWIATNPADVDGRERIFNALHANRKHRDYLEAYLTDGKLAAAELSRNAELAERKPRWQDIR